MAEPTIDQLFEEYHASVIAELSPEDGSNLNCLRTSLGIYFRRGAERMRVEAAKAARNTPCDDIPAVEKVPCWRYGQKIAVAIEGIR